MEYKVETEYEHGKYYYQVYYRPDALFKWKKEISFTTKRAAQQRIKFLQKNFTPILDWSVKYEYKDGKKLNGEG